MPLRILIVEDEVLIAETIKWYLEEQGHHVQDICISYEEAESLIERESPDLVILDIRLYGERSGIDFAEFLQQQPQKVPFIYLTWQNDRRIFQLALATTPYGYLAKPIQKDSLWTTVETAYRLYQEGEDAPLELTIFDGQKNYRIREKDILYIKSDHVYANLYMNDGRKIITRKPLSQLAEEAQSPHLFHCHRSYIVNTQQISGWDNDSVTLSNGEVIPVSRSKRQQLLERL
ncbi:MAG: DNA-binding response regulator [Phaeodactylibacter sp.]|nr:DNA-binding response regulator [Phaeodactylibacter sp.]